MNKINLKISSAKVLTILAFLSISITALAKENTGKAPIGGKTTSEYPTASQKGLMKMGSGCLPASAQVDLDVNSVRTTILNGGDMWWNLSNAKYEIPKVPTGQVAKHSLFAGALWIGGITQGNLRLAAQTYRQSGNDFFPGPLQTDGSASIAAQRCKDFDKIWKITFKEIDDFRHDTAGWVNSTGVIAEWPGNGGPGEAKNLAPFVDIDNDGTYDPFVGDYPSFDQNNPDNIPDMMLYILYNDKGNIHSETQGFAIGLELHTQAFGYVTNDQVNYMTFYRTTIINRSNESIDSCIFGQWADPDLGNYSDDYVECDVARNLGICYNGDDNDEGILGYGLNPPSIGINFFEGPRRADGSEIGLTKFVYYNNDFSTYGNPSKPEHFWYYLNGKWKDRSSIDYGGNGHDGGDTASYMFPGSTDPAGRAEWTERTAGNTPADRRFLQTAGSFTLLPGAVNRVTIGVVWAKATSGGATGSFNLLKQASDKAYKLYKNNFQLVDGPAVPLLQITELNKELILSILGTKTTESYVGFANGKCATKTMYKFQGYQIYQMKDAISSNLDNKEEARLVAQCDLKDGKTIIVNQIFDPELNEDVKKIMVNGSDTGVAHSFRVTKDLFSKESDQTLVNFKTYYFKVVAYATADCIGDLNQYIAGRKQIDGKEIKITTGIPHNPIPHGQGTFVNAGYNDGPEIQRIEGVGNGGNSLKLTQKSIDEALVSPFYAKFPTYQKGSGPLKIKVINPLKVPLSNFEVRLRDTSANNRINDSLSAVNSYWILKNLTKNDSDFSETSLKNPNEQIFTKYGLSLTINQPIAGGYPDDLDDGTNGFIESNITFSDPSLEWLSGVRDELVTITGLTIQPFNWIRSGVTGKSSSPPYNHPELNDDYATPAGRAVDPRRNYAKIIDGTWSPYSLVSKAVGTYGPGFPLQGINGYSNDNPLTDMASVDVVFTSDKTKWTRCIVIELGENPELNIGRTPKGNIRWQTSIDKDGNPEPSAGKGMSWFPGYAINVETGERLNIMFGEDSSLPLENGTDMVWNPTKSYFDQNAIGYVPSFGGKHHIYVMGAKNFRATASGPILYPGPNYDECASYKQLIQVSDSSQLPPILSRRYVFSQMMWVSIPLLSPKGFLNSMKDGLIPSEATIKLRVKKPYAAYLDKSATDTLNKTMPLYRFSTESIAPQSNNKEAGNKALDMVNVVPNPYMAYSAYEDPGNQLDNKIKIVNVPKECVVSIYTQNGFLVRRIRKNDDSRTYIDWDLKNDANVPISSGFYIIHIEAKDLGERIIKWFGIMRPSDFDSF